MRHLQAQMGLFNCQSVSQSMNSQYAVPTTFFNSHIITLALWAANGPFLSDLAECVFLLHLLAALLMIG